MNIFKNAALALALTAIGFTASAQKIFTEGIINYDVSTNGKQNEAKTFFKGDSSSYQSQMGPANINILSNVKGNYMAFLVDVPVASMKKAAVLTPADIEQMKDQEPNFTFTPTSETQTIAGFNCKKVLAKDSKSGSTSDVWVTNDITVPANNSTKYFANAGGYPVKFTIMQGGQTVQVTLKSIVAEKVKPGTFGIPKDFDRITFQELMSMGGGR
ncbi:MAG: DUF4412 domain-containing protein [Mucilaginibacter sp.]|uniref:DUF4412 domain-containing protein n=1 Tax=Mucilaginibacter sp. TaxID=1882438 RepID=UPI0034E52E17